MQKRLLSLALLSILGLSACAPAPSSPPPQAPPPWKTAEIMLSYATAQHNQPIPSLQETITHVSDGRIYLNSYFAGQMGTDLQLMQAVQNGSITMVQCATSMQVAQVPEIALMDVPYLFYDVEGCNRSLKDGLLDFFQPYYNQAGLQLITLHCTSFRQLTSTVPITRIEDLADLRLRTMENPYHIKYWSDMGAQVYPLEYSKLFYALQQGVVNAQENTLSAARSIQLDQVQDYVIETDHIPFVTSVVMNKDAFDALSAEDQALLTQAVQTFVSSSRSTAPTQSPASWEVLPLSPALRQQLKDGTAGVREMYARDLGEELVSSFYALIEP